MTNASKFWDRIAERYARRPVADESAYQEKLKITQEYLGPGMEVLEIGCGTGSTAIAHAPNVGHIRAIDLSEKMLEIAQQKANAAGIRNVSFEQLNIDQLKVVDSSLDMVMAHSILHLLEGWEEEVRQIYHMLRPGGIFVSSTACLGDSMAWFRYVAPLGRWLGLLPGVEIFTREALVKTMKSAGFRVDRQWQPKSGAAVFIVAVKER